MLGIYDKVGNNQKNILKLLYLFVIWNEELLEWEIKIKTKKKAQANTSQNAAKSYITLCIMFNSILGPKYMRPKNSPNFISFIYTIMAIY